MNRLLYFFGLLMLTINSYAQLSTTELIINPSTAFSTSNGRIRYNSACNCFVFRYSGSNVTPPLVSAPGAGQTGQSVRWNNGTSSWEYFTPSVSNITTRNNLPPDERTTSFTLALADTSRMIVLNSASPITIDLTDISDSVTSSKGIQWAFYVKGSGGGEFDDTGVTAVGSLGVLTFVDQGSFMYLYYDGDSDDYYLGNGTPTGFSSSGITITDHSNIIITPSGSYSSAFLAPWGFTTTVVGAFAATIGGTGTSTVTTGDLLYGSATNTWSKLPDVAAGSYLRSGGVTTAPLWSTLILPNAATSGRVVIASGTNTYGEDADLTFNGTNLNTTTLTVAGGSTISGYIKASATLDFPSTAAGTCEVLTITLTGAAVGDLVMLGIPSSIDPEGIFTTPRVSATNTVEVKFCNIQTVGALDPASGTYTVAIIK